MKQETFHAAEHLILKRNLVLITQEDFSSLTRQ